MDQNFFTKMYSEYFSLKTDYAKYAFLLALSNFKDYFSETGLNEVNTWVNSNLKFLTDNSKPDITTR